MITIYFNLDSNGYLTGQWSTPNGLENEIELEVDDEHEVLTNALIFKFVDGELIKDKERQQELINERIAEENKLSESDMNTLAIFELAQQIENLKGGK